MKPAIEARHLTPLRPKQVDAWRASAEEATSLILGPPGTGKTTLLAWMVLGYTMACRMANKPCRVLVTAFTRNAIANLLEGISARAGLLEEDFLVSVVQSRHAPAISDSVGNTDYRDVAEMLKRDQVVVGMTTWALHRTLTDGSFDGASKPSAEVFDVVCLDEASQLKVTQGLMAIAAMQDAGRFVVAGDNRQLPPIKIFEDWAVNERALGGSMYDFLQAAQVPEHQLTETFRLNQPLASAPAEFFYDEYESAVPDRKLKLADGWEGGLSDWLRVALDPEYPVCVLLHEGPPASTKNAFEASLAKEIAQQLGPRLMDADGNPYGAELWSDGLAVVSPHRAQNLLIRTLLRDEGTIGEPAVETVDRIQGRERDAIIFSYTVADPEFATVESSFIFSKHRFNVAITRPRSKLILLIARRLLEVLPNDDDLVDALRVIREYVFESDVADTFLYDGYGGAPVPVEVRLRQFDPDRPLPIFEKIVPHRDPPPQMTAELAEIETAIRELAQESEYGSAADFAVARRLARQNVAFRDYRDLARLGRIYIGPKRQGTTEFWTFYPAHEHTTPSPLSEEIVRTTIDAAVSTARRGRWAPQYEANRAGPGVRDAFVWCDANGNDLLWPILENLQNEQRVILGEDRWQKRTVEVRRSDDQPILAPADINDIDNDTFRLLNLVEDREAERISLGVFESWIGTKELRSWVLEDPELSRRFPSRRRVLDALRKLEQNGFLLFREARVRSRMAELARELRYVKQRFRPGDAAQRPYLVRALKVLLLDRRKPSQDCPLNELSEKWANKFTSHPNAARLIRALVPSLSKGFKLAHGQQPQLSGFQERSFEAILDAYLGESDVEAVVITADTGSGKTEAACLPLMVGAGADRLAGIRGTRCVLSYPRIRLAVNQAERIVSYARLLMDEVDGLVLTVGLQSGQVPQTWEYQKRRFDRSEKPDEELWRPTEGGWSFPFFQCPACDRALLLEPGSNDAEADTLICSSEECDWRYAGWVGTKERLSKNPPAIFIPVTESLHQWLQDQTYGRLFGDGEPTWRAPKAVLADEIHLYSHVHGAQVGWTLRRLLARSRLNGVAKPLAIGMSATLGDPKRVWGELSGFDQGAVHHVEPRDEEQPLNPRGREYYYFVQPEVESRGKDIAAASTTIQAAMLLAHGMRRRTGGAGAFRGMVFLDSIDKLRRLHTDYADAETSELALLRTSNYGVDGNAIRTECCREPESCSLFAEGECWYFAASDRYQVRAGGHRLTPDEPLSVGRQPVFSGSTGNIERLIEGADIIFATSSLEVGFDDPDMALVYQHYAPANLASFVQRKGRGGRGSDDRPLTGTTLSIYSPRDSWYFRNPRQMLQAADFRVPINMNNIFVRRGQVISFFLDLAARSAAQTSWTPTCDLNDEIFDIADDAIPKYFGSTVFADLESENARDLWKTYALRYEQQLISPVPKEWRLHIEDVPTRLFDSINVPLLAVSAEGEDRDAKEEDVGLVFSECAPGRISRRWGAYRAHWISPRGPTALMFPEGSVKGRAFSLVGKDSEVALETIVPEEVLAAFPNGLAETVFRPESIEVDVAGSFSSGSTWNADWWWNDAKGVATRRTKHGNETPRVDGKSVAYLQGFVNVVETGEPYRALELNSLNRISDGKLRVFRATPGSKETGLRVIQSHWCSDVTIIEDSFERDRRYHRQLFTRDSDGKGQLFGYGMLPEGVRLSLDSAHLDAFLRAEIEELNENPTRQRWHQGQFLRYAVMTRTSRIGFNRYESKQLADLMISAATTSLREELNTSVKRWNSRRLREVLAQARDQHLMAHPVLTHQRVERLLERLDTPKLREELQSAVEMVADEDRWKGYLRSVVLHSLLAQLKQGFVLHGLGHERSVIGHAQLPLQYGSNAHDVLTVCERGSGGDGTTRTFLATADQLATTWEEQGVIRCPNAEGDDALALAFARTADHDRWRDGNPRDPVWVAALASELGLDASINTGPIQLLLRRLYDVAEIDGQRFELYDLYSEVRAVERELAEEFGRGVMDWELVSGVVLRATEQGQLVPGWSNLFHAYAGLEEASFEEALSPASRLADQVFSLGAKQCLDGCLACLHGYADMMDDALAETVTSRVLLTRFWEHPGPNRAISP